MRKLLLTYLILLLGIAGVYGQPIIAISLFDRALPYYNPAATGMEEALTANLFYRKNWTGMPGTPSTLFFTANAPLKNQNMALGVKLEHNSQGSQNHTGFYFDYAYRVSLGANKLSLALEGGIYSLSQDPFKLRDDQFDRAMNENNSSSILPNFGVGALYYGKVYWISLSVPRLLGLESKESGEYGIKIDSVGRDYILAGGATLSISQDFGIEPSAFFNYNSGLKFKFLVNVMAVYKERYKAGLGYRNNGALIFAFAFNINRQISLAYSYDLHLGEVSDLSSSSHEIHLQYTFGYKVNAANPRGF